MRRARDHPHLPTLAETDQTGRPTASICFVTLLAVADQCSMPSACASVTSTVQLRFHPVPFLFDTLEGVVADALLVAQRGKTGTLGRQRLASQCAKPAESATGLLGCAQASSRAWYSRIKGRLASQSWSAPFPTARVSRAARAASARARATSSTLSSRGRARWDSKGRRLSR